MFKLMRTNKKGFTLIELIVVIAILAILAAIAIPTFSGIKDNANQSVILANARSIATAFNAYNALNPDEDEMLDSIDITALTTAGLWPVGVTQDDLDDINAAGLLTIANHVALAKEASGS